jgi:hypothetical protein
MALRDETCLRCPSILANPLLSLCTTCMVDVRIVPDGALMTAAKAGDVPGLVRALEGGCSTEEKDWVCAGLVPPFAQCGHAVVALLLMR